MHWVGVWDRTGESAKRWMLRVSGERGKGGEEAVGQKEGPVVSCGSEKKSVRGNRECISSDRREDRRPKSGYALHE